MSDGNDLFIKTVSVAVSQGKRKPRDGTVQPGGAGWRGEGKANQVTAQGAGDRRHSCFLWGWMGAVCDGGGVRGLGTEPGGRLTAFFSSTWVSIPPSSRPVPLTFLVEHQFLFLFFLAVPRGFQDVSSPTSD